MPRRKILTALLVSALALTALVPTASAKMRSTKLSKGVCLTTGGGRFVDIPKFPGEKIDRRLKRDIRFLSRRYNIFVTDGFSTSPVHSAKGEHPIGLALDIIPNSANGGSWAEITELARWAEPRQNQPRSPFRWVGYNGDQNHGRGHHLHLSWSHSGADFGKPAKSVYTIKCPRKPKKKPDPPPADESETSPPPEGPDGGTESSGGVTSDGQTRRSSETGGVSAP